VGWEGGMEWRKEIVKARPQEQKPVEDEGVVEEKRDEKNGGDVSDARVEEKKDVARLV
ncbi:hypothetical protein EWM64_g7552, partial [Hericium alpestre]